MMTKKQNLLIIQTFTNWKKNSGLKVV